MSKVLREFARRQENVVQSRLNVSDAQKRMQHRFKTLYKPELVKTTQVQPWAYEVSAVMIGDKPLTMVMFDTADVDDEENFDPYLYVDVVLLGGVIYVHKFGRNDLDLVITRHLPLVLQYIRALKYKGIERDIAQGLVYGYDKKAIRNYVYPPIKRVLYRARHFESPGAHIERIRNQLETFT